MFLAGLLALGSCRAPTAGEPAASNKQVATAQDACGDVASYYVSNLDTRIWVKDGALTQKGTALAAALGAPATAVDEQAMSAAFLRLVGRMWAPPAGRPIEYVDRQLAPQRPCAAWLLGRVARAPRVEPLLERLQTPNILAEVIGQSQHDASDPAARNGLASDLALARSFGSLGRAIIVDSTGSRLWAIDGSRVVDSMKVITGKPSSQTPEMAALVRYALLNPYWDIPPDMVRSRIAGQVVEHGPEFLAERGYIAVDHYGQGPNLLDAASVDWRAVQAGTAKVGVRQRPGPGNMLGRVLFMFPNRLGIYLHDTPNRANFDLVDRHISNGCVRLERAPALYKWGLGRDLPPSESAGPDQRVNLPEPIPVYLVRFSAGGSRALMGLAPNSSA